MLRGSGAAWDLRKAQPYECYSELDFDIPIGKNGDNYDRYCIRMEEMRQAVKIMAQCCEKLHVGGGRRPARHRRQEGGAAQARRDEALDGGADPPLQALHGRLPRAGRRGLCRVEAPKGEFGVYLVADGSNKPYRCKIRAPGFPHLQAMDFMNRGHMLADVSAILGSLDIVFGEIDR